MYYGLPACIMSYCLHWYKINRHEALLTHGMFIAILEVWHRCKHKLRAVRYVICKKWNAEWNGIWNGIWNGLWNTLSLPQTYLIVGPCPLIIHYLYKG